MVRQTDLRHVKHVLFLMEQVQNTLMLNTRAKMYKSVKNRYRTYNVKQMCCIFCAILKVQQLYEKLRKNLNGPRTFRNGPEGAD